MPLLLQPLLALLVLIPLIIGLDFANYFFEGRLFFFSSKNITWIRYVMVIASFFVTSHILQVGISSLLPVIPENWGVFDTEKEAFVPLRMSVAGLIAGLYSLALHAFGLYLWQRQKRALARTAH